MEGHEHEQHPGAIQALLEAHRQDQQALELYWHYLQSHTEDPLLPMAYQLLYTAWSRQKTPETLDTLVDMACQRLSSDIETLTRMAQGEFEAKRDHNALKLYNRLLALQALNPQMYEHLKILCFRYQPFDDFVNLSLHQCLAYCPDDNVVIRFLFAQYLVHEKYTYTSLALPIYEKMLNLEPENLTVRGMLVECYVRQEKYEQAVAIGEEGLAYDKNHLDLLAGLAKAYYQCGEYGKVVTYCRQILAKRPGRSDMHVLLAEVYTESGLTTNEAIKAYRVALDAHPEHIAIRQILVRAYLRKLMLAEAMAEGEQVLANLQEQHDPSSQEFRNVVKVLIEEFERTLRRSPGELTLYLFTAKLHEQLGHFHQALMYYRTLLEWPFDPELTERLIGLFEQIAQTTSPNPHVFLYLGLLYHKVHRTPEAKAAFQTVMYSDLDDREVETLLIKHDRSIWQYPPVLVILAHHRIVTKEILEGLVQTFQHDDREDWNGAIWVLQELYDVDDVVAELHQAFAWKSFQELAPHLIPIIAQNGSQAAIQSLRELLSHATATIRAHALDALIQMEHPLAEQYVNDASTDNTFADIRLEIARYYGEHTSEQTTYHLTNMLRDSDPTIRRCVIQTLQHRDVASEPLRELLFTEQDPEVRMGIIALLVRSQNPEEAPFLAHLLTDLVTKRHREQPPTGTAKVYQRLKKLIGHNEKPEDIEMLSTLIQALGSLEAEQAIYALIDVATNDTSQQLRLEAIQALAQIGSTLAIHPLEAVLHTSGEAQDVRLAAEQAIDYIIQRNA